MQLINGVKYITGWGDTSSTADNNEKIASIVMLVGLGVTTITREALKSASWSKLVEFIAASNEHIKDHCQPIDNNGSIWQCKGPFPQAPGPEGATTDTTLAVIAGCIEVAILLMVLSGAVRHYTTTPEQRREARELLGDDSDSVIYQGT